MREANSCDIKDLCTLMFEMSQTTISPGDMQNRLQLVEKSQVDSLFVCEEDGQIISLLGFRIRENLEEVSSFGEISSIVVNLDERRKGVGRFMMAHAEKLAKELGCKGLWFVSGFSREEEAHKFYKQLGFQINGFRFVKLFSGREPE